MNKTGFSPDRTSGQKDWRLSSLEFGRVNTAWLGELMLVYAPVAIIALMVLATMSFVLGDGIAVNQRFELAWAWASALSVDGVMLALIVRAAKPEKTWKYGITLATLAPMIVVGIALLALVTMQQTMQISEERLAISMLGIDPTWLVIGRAVLTMFAALVGLVFSHLPPVTPTVIPETKAVTVRDISPATVPAPLELPEVALSHDTPVWQLLSEGMTVPEIADLKGVSTRTIHRRRAKELSEMSTRERAECEGVSVRTIQRRQAEARIDEAMAEIAELEREA